MERSAHDPTSGGSMPASATVARTPDEKPIPADRRRSLWRAPQL